MSADEGALREEPHSTPQALCRSTGRDCSEPQRNGEIHAALSNHSASKSKQIPGKLTEEQPSCLQERSCTRVAVNEYAVLYQGGTRWVLQGGTCQNASAETNTAHQDPELPLTEAHSTLIPVPGAEKGKPDPSPPLSPQYSPSSSQEKGKSNVGLRPVLQTVQKGRQGHTGRGSQEKSAWKPAMWLCSI